MPDNDSFVLIIILIYVLLALLVGLATHILHAIGLVTIARHRSLERAGLAWLPIVGISYVTGLIADHEDRQTVGVDRSLRKWLLGLSTFLLILQPIFFSLLFSADHFGKNPPSPTAVIVILLMVLSGLPFTVLWFIAHNKLYKSCQPDNRILFLVLSIVFSVTPFLVFAIRHHVNGERIRKS